MERSNAESTETQTREETLRRANAGADRKTPQPAAKPTAEQVGTHQGTGEEKVATGLRNPPRRAGRDHPCAVQRVEDSAAPGDTPPGAAHAAHSEKAADCTHHPRGSNVVMMTTAGLRCVRVR